MINSKMSKRTENILIERVKRDSNTPVQMMHFHPYYEIGYIGNGSRQMTIDHSVYSMEKGDMVFVNVESVHKGSNVNSKDEYIEWTGLYFTQEYMERYAEMLDFNKVMECFAAGVIKIPVNKQARVEEILSKMIHEYDKVDEMSPMLLQCYFGELIALIIRIFNNTNTYDVKINPDDQLIVDAAEYIYKNFNYDITLDKMADKYNMSKSHFSKRFKLVTGCGFKEYLINVRLKEACSLLLNTSQSITDIALSCGFSDSNYFGDAFKKIKGMSPKVYRKM